MSEAIQTEERRETSAKKRIREESEQSVLEYLSELSTAGAFEMKVTRVVPKTWPPGPNGQPCEGPLKTFDEPVSEEDLKDMFGGGTYKLEFRTPDAKGKMNVLTERTLRLPGAPRIDPNELAVPPSAVVRDGDPGLVKEAMRMTERSMNAAEERARRAEERAMERREDPSLRLMADQMRSLQESLAEKDRQVLELMRETNRQPDSRPTDRILDRMLEGESARIQSLRTQHESELRTLRENNREDIKRIEDRHDRAVTSMQDNHKREIDSIHRSHEQLATVQAASHLSVVEGYKSTINSLERELIATKTELAELRVRKEKSVLETLTEAAQMKEAMDAFGGGGDKDEEGGSTVERIIKGALTSPLAEGIAARLAGAQPQPAQQEAPELPVGRPMQMPDGRILVRRPDGQVVQLRRKQPQIVAGPGGEQITMDPAAVAQAIAFMESAVRNDTDPAEFANTARNLVPGDVLKILRAQGVDHFLSNIAKLDSASPLLTQHGKNWARKVAAHLLGDAPESE